MNRIYLIIILLFFISSSQAQLIRGYGAKIGATISNQQWDYFNISADFDPDARWGINFGVYAEFLELTNFSVITELNYVQKGMTKEIPVTTVINPDGTGEYITWDTRVDYINLSALAKFRIDFELLAPYLIMGPKLDFEINQEHSLGSANIVEENFNEIIYGAKIGLGSEFNLGVVNLLAEILYDFNINNLYENENLEVSVSSVDLRFGILF